MAAGHDDDARRTLAELEAKLRELERELLRGRDPGVSGAPGAPAGVPPQPEPPAAAEPPGAPEPFAPSEPAAEAEPVAPLEPAAEAEAVAPLEPAAEAKAVAPLEAGAEAEPVAQPAAGEPEPAAEAEPAQREAFPAPEPLAAEPEPAAKAEPAATEAFPEPEPLAEPAEPSAPEASHVDSLAAVPEPPPEAAADAFLAEPPPPPAPPPPALDLDALADVHDVLDELRATIEAMGATAARITVAARTVVDDHGRSLARLQLAARAAARAEEAAAEAGRVAGTVVIEAGPFADPGPLLELRDALAARPGTKDAYVRGVEDGRAVIEVHLAPPPPSPVAQGAQPPEGETPWA